MSFATSHIHDINHLSHSKSDRKRFEVNDYPMTRMNTIPAKPKTSVSKVTSADYMTQTPQIKQPSKFIYATPLRNYSRDNSAKSTRSGSIS